MGWGSRWATAHRSALMDLWSPAEAPGSTKTPLPWPQSYLPQGPTDIAGSRILLSSHLFYFYPTLRPPPPGPGLPAVTGPWAPVHGPGRGEERGALNTAGQTPSHAALL